MKTADTIAAGRGPSLRATFAHQRTAKPRLSSPLWHLCERLLDSPMLRAVVAACALYGVWAGLFNHYAATLHIATGLPALLISGAVQGAIAGHLVTGDVRGIGLGALSGAAFGLIGDISCGWSGVGRWLGRAALQGVAGGALAILEGRSFRTGLIGAVSGELALCVGLAAIHWI